MMVGAYLELVLASLSRCGRVEKINCENLEEKHHVSAQHSIFINQANVYIQPISNISILSCHNGSRSVSISLSHRSRCDGLVLDCLHRQKWKIQGGGPLPSWKSVRSFCIDLI